MLLNVFFSACLLHLALAKRPAYSLHKHEVAIHTNDGFYEFDFGKAGTTVPTVFTLRLRKAALLTVLDCYCVGDTVQVYDNGHSLGQIHGLYDGDMNCPVVETKAQKCWLSRDFAKGSWKLTPGTHKISIKMRDSPYEQGSAFLRVDDVCRKRGKDVPCCKAKGDCSSKVHS